MTLWRRRRVWYEWFVETLRLICTKRRHPISPCGWLQASSFLDWCYTSQCWLLFVAFKVNVALQRQIRTLFAKELTNSSIPLSFFAFDIWHPPSGCWFWSLDASFDLTQSARERAQGYLCPEDRIPSLIEIANICQKEDIAPPDTRKLVPERDTKIN